MLAPGPAKKVTIHLNVDTISHRDFLSNEILAFLFEQGVAGAAARLGELYAAGRGVIQDNSKAWFWLSVALRQGDKDADKSRARIAGKLSKDEIVKQDDAVRAWKPRVPPLTSLENVP